MEKCIFAYNPNSGKGRIAKVEGKIVQMLSTKYEVEVVLSQYAGHIRDVILQRGEGVKLFVVAGGDGTLNEAVDGLARLKNKPLLGYIPAGTVNDVAHSLKIPRSIKGAVKNILNGAVFSHDIIRVDDRYGIYVCCAGLFTETSYATTQTSKKKIGKLAYCFHGIKKVFTTPAFNVKLIHNDEEIEQKCSLIMMLNCKNVAGFPVNRRAILNDGKIDVMLIRNKRDIIGGIGFWGVVKLFLLGIRPKSDRNYKHYLLDEFDIEIDSNTVINLDGERVCEGSFHIKMIKEGVDIITPEKFIKKNEKIKEKRCSK